MMTQTTAEVKQGGNIVHESEVQRQYVRLQLPVEVEINGRHFISGDWSNGGLSVRVPEEDAQSQAMFREGAQLKALLLFKFGSFDINVPVEIEVRNIAAGRVGCRFVNLGPSQLSLLQFIVNAYITGEIVRAGDIIEIVSRNNTAPKRSVPAGGTQPAKRTFGWLAVLAASALLVAYIGAGIWERMFVITSNAGAVLAEPLVVEATKSGKIFFQPIAPGTQVKKGAPLLMVQTLKGNMESVDSPCNCIVRERLLDNYARVHTGEPVLRLLSADAAPYVEAWIPADQALRLTPGTEAVVTLPGRSAPIAGKVTGLEAGRQKAGEALVFVELSEKPSPEQIGGPATIRINTFSLRR